MGDTGELHNLLNKERTKRGLTYARWNQELWHCSKSHSDHMLGTRHLVHAPGPDIPSGGECIWCGKGDHSPRTIAKSWINSPGHRALILGPGLRSQAVAISRDKQWAYATWRGSNEAAQAVLKPIKLPNTLKMLMRRRLMPTNPVKMGLSLVLGVVGFLGMAMGVHGVYVYFNRLDLILGGEGARFLLVIDVPIRLQPLIMWASARGLQSWFIPTLVFLAGLWVFNYSRLWPLVSGFIAKIKP